MKIMIVDDEPIILGGIVAMVRECREDAWIEEASDGFEALEKLRTFRPDLLISDVNMPEMTGLELIEETKRQGYCDKYVILTGYDEFEYARQAVRLGVMDYLLKPVQEGELQSVIDRLGRHGESKEALSNRTDSNGSALTHAILEYIHLHYGRDLPLDEVAAHGGIHPNYLCAIMKRNIGKSFVHYLREYRMERAMTMFRDNPRVQIDKVAQSVGYEQPRHFYKVFKKSTGFTPGQFRDDCLKSMRGKRNEVSNPFVL
ncbi:response regulator transcription factor [Cohnella herbarum]|uniref:Response regulator n=1 Tax=Cohnella herbarum TaxID=2728023 RepID=A0A7Z2VQ88_9BACL|nr:response regulator [Cohnella herbarum]QJD87115.1 response regulator [Cohnella herbarum]